MNEDPYFGFILAAYLIGFAVIGLMILAILIDHAKLKRQLARLSARTGRPNED